MRFLDYIKEVQKYIGVTKTMDNISILHALQDKNVSPEKAADILQVLYGDAKVEWLV